MSFFRNVVFIAAIAGLLAGSDQTLQERVEWAKMLMDPTDISDVTGAVMQFLINGHGPRDNWTALFKPGERVRLRFINAAAQMIFNIRIPGLRMKVVQADGQNVRPVEVDEFSRLSLRAFGDNRLPIDSFSCIRRYTLFYCFVFIS